MLISMVKHLFDQEYIQHIDWYFCPSVQCHEHLEIEMEFIETLEEKTSD